ncbi:peptide chain release factor N(5)-glutamine methyltransferase [Treponema sp.]|uniref:peptide chain release factor N(5)-glutamine methyltransferase n=1 Tax=Treponema sp. TaxID=166 RepID=UPI00388D90DC
MTVQEAKLYGKSNLSVSPTPVLDTDVLLQHITGLDKTHLLLERARKLLPEQETAFLAAIEKRKTGLPVAYITGHKEFFGLDFYVTPDVLIPKPDTELLVELALDALEDKFRANTEKIPTVCDMCTGSGCVGLSILKTLADKSKDSEENKFSTFNFQLSISLVDISEKALDVARINAKRLIPDFTPHFVHSNLFENIPNSFDLIVTNPPYVPHTESLELLKDGRSEPLLALDGDIDEYGEYDFTEDGLSLIRRLVPQCYGHLNRNGVLIMETGEYNAEETAELFKKAGFRNVKIEYDMNEMMRDVTGVK